MKDRESTRLPSETLEMIRAEEEKARNLIAGAKEKESALILREARDAAKKIIEDRTAAARKLALERHQQGILDAGSEADDILKEADKQVVGMKAGADLKKEAAVRGVIKKIKELIQPDQQ